MWKRVGSPNCRDWRRIREKTATKLNEQRTIVIVRASKGIFADIVRQCAVDPLDSAESVDSRR
ncbi:hypothetical protein RBSH_03442 [Rhodopirellula baltica SH28]|uniref:Uncharacterized protein n=2 Tax=Rhodopirellula baltica TaxID=265606 RepID=F2AM68_RHOBT|nr:hypothetical protein RBWH47_00617 [Rhodopirellula baltica WH47]EKK01204.1 hypothetical protein RBSH_03442 [Rhodopirellula baltica SH28]